MLQFVLGLPKKIASFPRLIEYRDLIYFSAQTSSCEDSSSSANSEGSGESAGSSAPSFSNKYIFTSDGTLKQLSLRQTSVISPIFIESIRESIIIVVISFIGETFSLQGKL